MSAKRTTRTASIAAAATALVLGLFAASAVGWGNNEEPTPTQTTPTETTPTETTPTETTPTETTPAEQPAPVEETQPLSPQVAAPLAQVAPVPALTAPADEGVKGEAGTRDEGQGDAQPTVLAQATDTGTPADTQSSGRLAQTGFDVLLLAILGGVALAGSCLLFWRSRTA